MTSRHGRIPSDTGAPAGRRALLTVSGVIPDDVDHQIATGVRPRPDYLVLADHFDADLLDHARARTLVGRWGRILEWVAGSHLMLAWATFQNRRAYEVIVTDGEQVGLPYALLSHWSRHPAPKHLMITHIMSVPKKVALFRAFALRRRIDTFFVYASSQRRHLTERLGVPAERVVLTDFMVDTEYWSPAAEPPRGRTICSAGLEWRDYPTLVEAVRGLDVDVVLAAASPWSKRSDSSAGLSIPANVDVRRLDFADLRRLYAASLFVVVPLVDVPFQAGVTTILEAMAMGKAVILTRTSGQTDVVVDGETGMYVPPGDAVALRDAIRHLLDHPQEARRMGAAGRRLAEDRMDVERYARRLAGHVAAAR